MVPRDGRTYGIQKKTIYLAIFTDNIWSYLIWSTVLRRYSEVKKTGVRFFFADVITGSHSKQDLRDTRKSIYFPICTINNNVWSYLPWPLVIVGMPPLYTSVLEL